jgi:hypothetical protein
MKFRDTQLQKSFDRNLGEASDPSEDLRQVRALIATHELFRMLEGPHSERVHETVEHLLSPQMRPGLRRWYQRPGVDTDSATVEFRDELSRLAGESLEITPEISHTPFLSNADSHEV